MRISDGDDEPIDEAWLETAGYKGRWKLDASFSLTIFHWGVSLIHTGYMESESELEIAGIKTRGDLRRFLDAVDPKNHRSWQKQRS